MKISDTYREIANNPKYKDLNNLKNITKTLLNRARVRVQYITKKGKITPGFLAAKARLEESGLLTPSGNVSTRLPKERKNILTVLKAVTNFLDKKATTVKGQKTEQIKGEKKKVKQRGAKSDKPKKFKQGQRTVTYETEEPEQEQFAEMGDYWQIARDLGLFNFMNYEDFAEIIEELPYKISLADFEELILNCIDNGYDSDEIFSEFNKRGIGVDEQ